MRLFRNNVGTALTLDGRYIKFGLCEGSSDLIGFESITITKEMVGKKIARFCAFEIKHGTKATSIQNRFLTTVREMGGDARIMTEDNL